MILKCPKCDEIALKDDGQCLNCEFERENSQQNMSGQNVDGWVSVDDRLPEKDGEYIVFENGNCGGVHASIFCKKIGGFTCYKSLGEITHWHPTPEPPKE